MCHFYELAWRARRWFIDSAAKLHGNSTLVKCLCGYDYNSASLTQALCVMMRMTKAYSYAMRNYFFDTFCVAKFLFIHNNTKVNSPLCEFVWGFYTRCSIFFPLLLVFLWKEGFFFLLFCKSALLASLSSWQHPRCTSCTLLFELISLSLYTIHGLSRIHLQVLWMFLLCNKLQQDADARKTWKLK